MNNSILITGGLGYVGGRLVSHLKEFRYNLDVIVTTRKEAKDRPVWAAGITVRQMDLLNDDSISTALKGIDVIVHLAALNEIESVINPERALVINGLGTFKLLKFALSEGVKRVIYLSTAHVYGAPLTGTITELTPARPVHPYAITHKTAEDFILASNIKRGLLGIVLRPSNGFGAPADIGINRWTLVVNDLCRQAVTSRKITLRSSGLDMRDFVTLEDICRGIDHFIELPIEDCAEGLFNLGGECSMRIIDMAKRIAERCSCVLGFIPEIIRANDLSKEVPPAFCYNIEKLKKTGFSLRANVDNEIDNTLRLCLREFGKPKN